MSADAITAADNAAGGQVPPEAARRMLDGILRVRLIEQGIAEVYAKEQLMRCPTHFSIGQEAVAVGVCSQMTVDEKITSAHRSHAHYLAKGGDLKAMVAELYGKATGCANGKGGSMHLVDNNVGFIGAVPVVGATIPIGVGCAFASVLKKDPTLTVIFFGDGAAETGVFHESLAFAVLHKLPVVMVCENNLYSVLSALDVRQPPGRKLVDLAAAHGALALGGDGNDPDEVYRLTGQAFAHARSGKGPVFLEFATYRWLEHCGPLNDEHLGYRPEGELDDWKSRDPLAMYSKRLMERGLADAAEIEKRSAEIRDEVAAALDYGRESPFPARSELDTYLYAS
ncbi:thiamine pyrophosphate-dependent dehydrogenase E1 component subunit alpha [Marinibaculum pumilum]|uniref:Thiamine pyrophosphate-dependent dehydrogenase E1 component subunit alpha n=1 Tax=Marinibaculum pumilum TaxID=1766165 RepID=A0ABV7KXX5_9PROT